MKAKKIRNVKQFTVVLVFIAMLMGMVMGVTLAETVEFAGGTGTVDDPYQIANAGQLELLSQRVNGKVDAYAQAHYILIDDIEMPEVSEGGSNHTAIGIGRFVKTTRFHGTFDGNNKTISGLVINKPVDDFQGLFGYIEETGVVKNVVLANSNINGEATVGGVAAENYGIIDNCSYAGKISVSAKRSVYLSGITGRNYYIVSNSTNYSEAILNQTEYSSTHVGGVVGLNTGTVKNCYNYGTFSLNTSNSNFILYIGGVVAGNAGLVEELHNYTDINTNNLIGTFYMGGVLGVNYGNGTAKNSSNSGRISSNSYTGGVAADNNGILENCNNTADVSGSNTVGGIVGNNYGGSINNSCNSGYISGNSAIGGIAGNNWKGSIDNSNNNGAVSGNSSTGGVTGSNRDSTIANSINTGKIMGSDSYSSTGRIGGITGDNAITSTVINCKTTGDVSGYISVGGVVGENSGTLKNSNNSGDVGGYNNIGGIVGYNYYGIAKDSYNSGDVSGKSYYVGNIVGSIGAKGKVENCYYIYVGDINTTYNDIIEELTIGVEKNNPNSNFEINSFQWYKYSPETNNGQVIAGAITNELSIPTDLNAGDYYYYADATIQWTNEVGDTESITATCKNAKVFVDKATPILPVIPVFEATYGQTVGNLTLPDWESLTPVSHKNYIKGTFSWGDERVLVGNVDDNINIRYAVFTPDEEYLSNYKILNNAKVGVKVNPIIIKRSNLSWRGIEERTYDTKKSNVRAYADNLLGDDVCNIIVNGGDVTDAGLYIATTGGVDNNNYKLEGTNSVYFIIHKADPVFEVPTDIIAIYGDTLGDVELPRGFSWEDDLYTSVGTVGKRSFKATFTPEVTKNYNIIEGNSIEVTIEKAMPEFAVPIDLTAIYGGTIGNIQLPEGFSWQNGSSSVGNVGESTFFVTFTPEDTDNYLVVTDIEVSINVTPKMIESVNLIWTGIEERTYDGEKSYIRAYADNLEYGDICNISVIGGDAVNAGIYTVTTVDVDNENYQLAGLYSIYYLIHKADPVYEAPSNLTATYGDPLADVTLPEGFSWEDSSKTAVGNAGVNKFIVTFTPADTDNYNVITEIEVTIDVAKADPEYAAPADLTAIYNETLADIALPDGFSWEDALDKAVGNAGANQFFVTYTPVDTDNYNVITGIEIAITVAKANPEYTAPAGSIATFGDTLADVTLPEGFSWETAPATSVGNAGANQFFATYTPADTDNYNVLTGIEVVITVAKADPEYSAPADLTVAYGETLVDVALPEGFSWEATPDTAVGAVGTNKFLVTYTPIDTDNFNVITGIKVVITVAKANPEYFAPADLTATYGEILADVELPEGFSWEAASDTAAGNAGENKFIVTFTPADTDNYNVITGIEVIINVAKADPDYEVPSNLTATYGDTLADVALPDGFSWAAAPDTAVGSAGTNKLLVTFTPVDNDNYNVITEIEITIDVAKADPEYVAPAGLTAIYNETLADIALPDGFSWEVDLSTAVGEIGSNTFNIRYTPGDTNNYNIIEGITVTIKVGKATPEYSTPTNLTAIYGNTLGDVILPAGFSWLDGTEKSVGNAGVKSFMVTYTPEDTEHYIVVSDIKVSINIAKADPKYDTPAGLTATYGGELADVALPKGFSWEAVDAVVGGAGSNNFFVTYTPADTDNYNVITGIEVTIDVSKADPEYNAPMGLTATYSDTLADVALPYGFSWEAAADTVVGNVGLNKFFVTYTPADTENYNVLTGIEVTTDVSKANPDYITPTGLTAIYGNTLDDVVLPEGFSWEAAHDTIVGDTGSNKFLIKYYPADTSNYNVIAGIEVTITVSKANPQFSVPANLSAEYGKTLADVQLPSGFKWIDNLNTLVGELGSNSFSVRYIPEDIKNYNIIKDIAVTVKVGKATPSYSVPANLVATYGDTLGEVTLPTGFSWKSSNDFSVGNVGANKFMVTFTPQDTEHYIAMSDIEVTITVSKVPTKYVYSERHDASGITIAGLENKISIPEKDQPDVEEVTIAIKSDNADKNSANIAIIDTANGVLKDQRHNLLTAFDISVTKRVLRIDGTVEENKVPNSDITDFITMRIPISQQYRDLQNLAVAFIDDDGTVEILQTKRVTIAGEDYLEFNTNHFSLYAIVELGTYLDEEPNGSEDDESNVSDNDTESKDSSDPTDSESSTTNTSESNSSGMTESNEESIQTGPVNNEEPKDSNLSVYIIIGSLILAAVALFLIIKKRQPKV